MSDVNLGIVYMSSDNINLHLNNIPNQVHLTSNDFNVNVIDSTTKINVSITEQDIHIKQQ